MGAVFAPGGADTVLVFPYERNAGDALFVFSRERNVVGVLLAVPCRKGAAARFLCLKGLNEKQEERNEKNRTENWGVSAELRDGVFACFARGRRGTGDF